MTSDILAGAAHGNPRATVAARLDTHEAVCAERYGTILARVGRLERIVIIAAGAVITGLASIVIMLLRGVAH